MYGSRHSDRRESRLRLAGLQRRLPSQSSLYFLGSGEELRLEVPDEEELSEELLRPCRFGGELACKS